MNFSTDSISSKSLSGIAKKTLIIEFLEKLEGQEVAITMGTCVWSGKITSFDDKFIAIEDADGMSLLKIDEISAIDYVPKVEIVSP